MTIPTWNEVREKEVKGEKLDPLEYYVYEYEVCGKYDVKFREDLRRLVKYIETGT